MNRGEDTIPVGATGLVVWDDPHADGDVVVEFDHDFGFADGISTGHPRRFWVPRTFLDLV